MPTRAGRSRSTARWARARGWRCAPTRRGCSGAIRRWCCTAAATPRSRPRWRTCSARRTRCCASRARAGTWATIDPSGLRRRQARARCASCARCDDLSDEDMVRVQRAYLLDPLAPNPSVEIAAARLPAAQVRRPHARQCRARPDRPAQRRGAGPRGLRRRASGSCPTTARASACAQGGGRGARRQARGRGPDPRQARHLHLRRDARARPTSA